MTRDRPAGCYFLCDPGDQDRSSELRDPSTVGCPGEQEPLVVRVQPGSPTVQSCLAAQILTSLGKDLGAAGTPKSLSRQWDLITAWIAGHGLDRLVFVGVEHLDAGLWRRLFRLADNGPAVLLVSHAQEHSRGHRRVLADVEHATVDPGDIGAWRGPPSQLPQASGEPALPPVPGDPNPFFLIRAKRTLTTEEYWAVRSAFRDGARFARTWLQSLGDDAHDAVEASDRFATALPTTADAHRNLAVLRGAQAELLRHRIDLQIDPRVLLEHARREHRINDHPHVQRLCWYTEPSFAALAAMTLAWDYTPMQLSALNIDQIKIRPELTINVDRHIGPPAVQAAVRAHVADITARSSNPHGPLFVTGELQRLTPRNIQQRLRTIATETGLPVATRTMAAADRRGPDPAAGNPITIRAI